MSIFNHVEWAQKIKDPLWCFEIPEVLAKLTELHNKDRQSYEGEKERIYDFFEEQLGLGTVALGTTGKDFDRERKPIDMIVIHHTSNLPGLTKERLSAIELLRLYAPQYAGKGPTYDANNGIKGAPIYSGHFRNGVQVFWPYHWMVRENGVCERLLNEDEVGWQAGRWDVNCRIVAICIDDDHEDTIPDRNELRVIASLIKAKYPHISKERIFGHCEINTKTTCPSKLFLSAPGRRGWKPDLQEML